MILNSNGRGTVWNNQGVFFFFFFKFSLPKWTLRLLIPIIEKWGTPEWLSYGQMCQFIQINNSARKSVLKKKGEICLRKLKTNRFLRQKAFKILWVLIYHVQNYLQRKINKLNQFFGIGKPPTQSLSPNKIHCVIWLEKILRISLSLHATRYI